MIGFIRLMTGLVVAGSGQSVKVVGSVQVRALLGADVVVSATLGVAPVVDAPYACVTTAVGGIKASLVAVAAVLALLVLVATGRGPVATTRRKPRPFGSTWRLYSSSSLSLEVAAGVMNGKSNWGSNRGCTRSSFDINHSQSSASFMMVVTDARCSFRAM